MYSVEKKLPEAFGMPQPERKTLDQLRKNDPSKAMEQLEKSKDFAIKMMLAEAKNADPFDEEGGSNKSAQMLQTANLIAQLDSAMVQVTKMDQMVQAIKNPGYNAISLQGQEVTYDDSIRYFNGEGNKSLRFNYNLSHADEYKGLRLNTTINIKNSEGKVVYKGKGADLAGDQFFDWNGRDNSGKVMPQGSYTIEVQSSGSKLVDGKNVAFNVKASSVLRSTVKSVEIENGVASKIVLANGKIIDKDQVLSSQDARKDTSDVKLSDGLIGKNVELDLTKVQVKGDAMDVYFNNHISNPGKAFVKVYDESGKFVKTLDTENIKQAGFGKITFNEVGLPAGNYTVKVSVEDINDKETGPKELAGNTKEISVIGINHANKTLIDIDGQEFNAHNVSSVKMHYVHPIDQRAANYKGQKVSYNDPQFTFYNDNTALEATAEAPTNAGDIFNSSELRIFNKNNEMVATLRAQYEPYNQLDDESREKVDDYIAAINPFDEYNDLEEEDLLRVNREIEENLQNGNYKLAGNAGELFAKGLRQFTFPKWDGTFNMIPGQQAQEGEVFTYEYVNSYMKPNDNSYFSETFVAEEFSIVDSVDKEAGELFLNLQNGKRIREDQLI